MNRVLIVESSVSHGRLMTNLLLKAGYDPILSECLKAGEKEVKRLSPGAVIVVAMKLQDGNARDLIDWLKENKYGFPVIAVVDNFNANDVLHLTENRGAMTVIQRLALDKQLVEYVERYSMNENETFALGAQLLPRKSKEWQEIDRKIRSMARSNSNVIVFGSTGTGKEQVALQLYLLSQRSQKPHMMVEAGGAGLIGKHDPQSGRNEIYSRIKGYFHDSDGGTIIVKNLHLLNMEKQSILLHILEEEHPNVRVICTAEPYLRRMVAEREFRPNLLYMLKELEISIPPISETTEDIPVLADYFLKMYAEQQGERKKKLDSSATKMLKGHPWFGNVRELKNVILQAAFDSCGDVIKASDLILGTYETDEFIGTHLKNPGEEQRRINDALNRTGGNKTQAAKILNISRNTLGYKMKQYGLEKL